MSGIEIQETVDAPIEKVFAQATDFANAARFIEGIHQVEMLTDGPVASGTRFKETRTMFGREATEVMTVGLWEPPHRYGLDAASHGCRYESLFEFKEIGSSTTVVMKFTAVPLTFFAKIMTFLTKPMLKSMAKLCAKDLSDLKRAAEAESS